MFVSDANLTPELTAESRDDEQEFVHCPVCDLKMKSLKLLNRHLDNDHGFGS
ncbi:hypothetical protein Kpol_1055p1, partial [Vanderwaltozyma polyspora DSM 70294]